MLVVALTGGIGVGKSTAARLLAARGAAVIDADEVARAVVEPGTPALARIVEDTCRAHGVRYRCEPTLRSALAANWRWLRGMGSPVAA